MNRQSVGSPLSPAFLFYSRVDNGKDCRFKRNGEPGPGVDIFCKSALSPFCKPVIIPEKIGLVAPYGRLALAAVIVKSAAVTIKLPFKMLIV